ncbi:Serine/threonine-protein kinase SRPK-like protein [Cladobotryum mycophilum]|uniref:Serine/threonine-protein kinase SRPK-like protein n=1 Tax=Cladobotryum mycophilum TaxID=491253 RepID=A0ABR0SEY8_9HYPO
MGEVLVGRYQLFFKTVLNEAANTWMGRDLVERRYVSLKIYRLADSIQEDLQRELAMYERITQCAKLDKPDHHDDAPSGRHSVTILLDNFTLVGEAGEHQVLVYPAMWESLKDFTDRRRSGRVPAPYLRRIVKEILYALRFLHEECQVIHTNLNLENKFLRDVDIGDICEEEIGYNFHNHAHSKEVNGRPLYMAASPDLHRLKKISRVYILDLAHAVLADEKHTKRCLKQEYRAPEDVLGIPWGKNVDLWALGCMVWKLHEGTSLFSGVPSPRRDDGGYWNAAQSNHG